MLDPSSSEEEEDEREVTPPRRPGVPAATAAAIPPAAASMTPDRRRAYADNVSRSDHAGTGFAPAISVDQRSMSTASRASYDDSGDNTSVTGTPSPGGPLHRPSGASLPPPPSPSLSASSPGGDRADAGLSDQDRPERDEEDRQRCMQIYVFVIRCIAYPFNAKQPTDMVRRQVKVNKQQMHSIRDRFQVIPRTHTIGVLNNMAVRLLPIRFSIL